MWVAEIPVRIRELFLASYMPLVTDGASVVGDDDDDDDGDGKGDGDDIVVYNG